MYSWEIFSNYVDHVSIVDKDASASDQRPRPSDVVRVRRSCTMAPSNNTSYAISEAASDDLHDYDVISDTGPGSLDSSIADLAGPPAPPKEIPPSAAARNAYDTTILSPEDIQTNVQRALRGGSRNGARSKSREPVSERETERTIRLYVDGVFDFVHAGTALQLRQARLSFPAVQLLVGPFTDESCRQYSVHAAIPHTERCELMRHIRWVDEVIFDAPVVLNEDFIRRNRIDFVAIEEGSSVDPLIGKERLRGYDLVKSLGKSIITRRTRGLVAPTLALIPIPPPSTPLRQELESLKISPPAEESSRPGVQQPIANDSKENVTPEPIETPF